jgi:hypothetical protein
VRLCAFSFAVRSRGTVRTQVPVDSCDQCVEIQRFLKKLCGERVRTTCGLWRQCADDKERHTGAFKVLVIEKIPAGHRCHAEIRDDEVGLMQRDAPESFLAAPGCNHVQTLRGQHATQALQHGGVIIYQQDRGVLAGRA